MILNAIGSHPEGASVVAMIATDGVYFLRPHPGLDTRLSERLGDWSRAAKHDLTLFKPGVYWDAESRERINLGLAPRFKARGINAQDFARSISEVDALFDTWKPGLAPDVNWPVITFRARFAQVSVLQAVQWTAGIQEPDQQEAAYRRLAGHVTTDKELEQDSEPIIKRNARSLRYDDVNGVWRTEPWSHKGWPESTPYEKRFGMDLEMNAWDQYATPDGSVMLGFREALYAS